MKLHHEQFNDLVDRINNKGIWFDDFIKLCGDYYEKEPVGGSLHIVLDDGNLKDCHIIWCEGYACGAEDDEGKDIASLMLNMSMTQRKKVYNSYPYSN